MDSWIGNPGAFKDQDEELPQPIVVSDPHRLVSNQLLRFVDFLLPHLLLIISLLLMKRIQLFTDLTPFPFIRLIILWMFQVIQPLAITPQAKPHRILPTLLPVKITIIQWNVEDI